MSNFDTNGNYNKTNWKTGDKITADKLNKIEESLETINNKTIYNYNYLLDESVSVKTFGAKGDGISDDTIAIQKALDVGGNVYFPEGVYIVNRLDDETSILKITKDTTLYTDSNATIKVGQKANQYYSVLYANKKDIKISLFNMNFDGNGSFNPQTPHTGEDRFTDLPYWRFNCCWFEIGSLFIDNCIFNDFYGTHVVLYWQNRNNENNSYVDIRNSKFLNIGKEYGSSLHDHSSLYVHKDAGVKKSETLNIFINNCVFKGVLDVSTNAINAMEMGGEYCYFTNNTIENYITGCMTAPLLDNCKAVVKGNTITNVATGIMPWSNRHPYYVTESTYENPKYENLIISDNFIKVNPNLFLNIISYVSKSTVNGVYPYRMGGIRLYEVATHHITRCEISNNYIEFIYTTNIPRDVFFVNDAHGIKFVGSSSNFNCGELIIKDNELKNVPKLPIYIQLTFIENTYIENNIFDNVCLLDRGQVFFIKYTETGTKDLLINNNLIKSGDFGCIYYLSGSTTNFFENLYVVNNIINPSKTPITQYVYYDIRFNNVVVDDYINDLMNGIYMSVKNFGYQSSKVNQSLKFGDNTSFNNGKLIIYDKVMPTRTDITFTPGDICYNTQPSTNDYIGWVNITSGKPGTWSGFGKIGV